jgi:hypothetical protein
MTQQAILKAVEVSTSSTLAIYANYLQYIYSPSKNIYANILELVKDIADQADSDGFTFSFSADFKIKIGGKTITNVGGYLADDFGFTGTETAGDPITATYTPLYMWLPTYHSSDTNQFMIDTSESFKGTLGSDGNIAGVAFTARKKRTVTYPWEHAYNAIEGACDATAAQQARCFVKVINDARRMVLSYSGSGNLNTKGVYFIENLKTITDSLPDVGDWASGDIDDDYIYCTADAPQITGASDDTNRAYYDLSVNLTSAVAPTWGS